MNFVAKTLFGLEKVLAGELETLGADNVKVANRAVLFTSDKYLLYKANYCLRTALSILMPVKEFRIRSKDDLYKGGSGIEWDKYMSPDQTFSISPVVNSTYFDHSGYAGLILKDSIADYFRKNSGRRPSVNSDDPGILINLHISNDHVTVSIDSSVVPLFKRGYRQEQATAPLNEALAAGILLISGWDATSSLTDPMCGSGTIPIEAGLIACNIPPGKFRKYFGFQKWIDFEPDLFEKVRGDCERVIKSSPVRIYASDISETAVIQTKTNIARAGLADAITVSQSDFRDLKCADDNGFLALNPPYGIRIQPEELNELYSMIGSTLKHNFSGNTAWLITSNKESLKHVGLKPKEKHVLYNGALECMLLKYELYQGTMKHRQPEAKVQ
jgi:putative N6-adenine-specific DNA methylase